MGENMLNTSCESVSKYQIQAQYRTFYLSMRYNTKKGEQRKAYFKHFIFYNVWCLLIKKYFIVLFGVLGDTGLSYFGDGVW